MGWFSCITGTSSNWEEVNSEHGAIRVPSGSLCQSWSQLSPGEVKQISRVAPGLFLGSLHAAADVQMLQKMGITHILNMAGRNIYMRPTTLFGEEIVVPQATDKFKYRVKEVKDDMNARMVNMFAETSSFIRQGVAQGGVLIHCTMGVSRSTTCLLAYLIDSENMSLDQALAVVTAARKSARPNTAFMTQLKQYEKKIHGNKFKSASPPSKPNKATSASSSPLSPVNAQSQNALMLMAGIKDGKV